MAVLEFRDVRLQDQWRDANPGKVLSPETERLRSWHCMIESRMVGHCTGDSMSGEIIGLSVVDAYRRQGIGTKLLSLLVEALRAAGVPRVWLAGPFDPARPAYGFYSAVGWVPTGERTKDGFEIWEPRAGLR